LRSLGLKNNIYFNLSLRRHDSRNRLDHQRVGILNLSSNRVFVEVESKGNVLHVLYAKNFLVFTTNQQRPEIDFAHVKENVRLLD